MGKVLIIGAGGVATVAAVKVAKNSDVFDEIMIASRTVSKCEAIAKRIADMGLRNDIKTAQVDADNVPELVKLFKEFQPDLVMNLALPYQDLTIMEACLEAGCHYLDTANYEPKDEAHFEYSWQWAYRERFEKAGLCAILGCGFDPGVTSIFTAYAAKHHFDEIHYLDIVDCNAGDHGKAFATNFNPEINFREFTGQAWTWQQGQWVSNQMFEVRRTDDLPVVGTQSTYLTGHDEIHSLSQILKIPTIRFWMGFGEHYINVFSVLKSLGLLSEQPVQLDSGQEVVPLQLVKAVLPDPASLAPDYTGKTCIGTLLKGEKDGKAREVFLYNVCDHAETYAEIGSQAISYTAGVPAAAAALLIADGTWDVQRMVNVEELPPLPLLRLQAGMGLPTRVREGTTDVALEDAPEAQDT